MRDVAAERFFGQVVSGGLEGPRAAAAADPFELAPAAFALQPVVVPQGREDLCVFPDMGEGRLPHVATDGGKKTAGLDVTHVGDEAEADAA